MLLVEVVVVVVGWQAVLFQALDRAVQMFCRPVIVLLKILKGFNVAVM